MGMWIKFYKDSTAEFLNFYKLSLIVVEENSKGKFDVLAYEAGTEYNWTLATYNTREMGELLVEYILFKSNIIGEVLPIPTEEELLKWKE